MKRIKILTAMLFFTFLTLAVRFSSQALWEGDWEYKTVNAGSGIKLAMVGGYRLSEDSPEVLTVPYSLGGYRVAFIANLCFQDAWPEYERLPTPHVLILPDGVLVIGSNAFCFSDLEEIRIRSNTFYETVDGVLFQRDGHKLIAYPKGKKNLSYTVPEGTEVIGGFSFSPAQFLEELHMPDSVRLIEENAFDGFHSSPLTVYLPETVETVMPGAFRRADSGIRIISSSSRYRAADDMLIDTQEKTLLTYTGCSASSSSEREARDITVPEEVETIGKQALDVLSCHTLVFPSILKAIGENNSVTVFSGVLEFPEGLETIGNYFNALKVKVLSFPSSLRSLGKYCFNYGDVESVFFQEGTESIGSGTFEGCENLRSVFLPRTLRSIGKAFSGCPNLQVFGLPDTAAEEFCRKQDIPFQYAFLGQWQADNAEAEKVLSLPGAESIRIRLTESILELIWNLNGSEHRESFPVEWKDGRLCMDDGYMNYTFQDLNHLILDLNEAQLRLTRMEEAE